MSMSQPKLPPLNDEVYDGFKGEKVDLSNMPRCTHKNVTAVSGTELKCSCGAGWVGSNVANLYNLLKNQK